MTYKESYMQATSLEDLMEKGKKDAQIALFLGANPDRMKAIEDAMNEVAKEKGWDGEQE